jgi:hypothetical protein
VTAKYLLPCDCGRQIVVEKRQAGQTMLCSCGASLSAPTLLDMTGLEPAAPEPVIEPAPSTWGSQQRLRMLGILLVLAALAGGVWLFFERPRSRFDVIDPERIRETCQSFTPSHTWDVWERMKKGLDRRTDLQYAAAVERFHVWQAAVAAIALAGAAMIAIGTVGARGQGN